MQPGNTNFRSPRKAWKKDEEAGHQWKERKTNFQELLFAIFFAMVAVLLDIFGGSGEIRMPEKRECPPGLVPKRRLAKHRGEKGTVSGPGTSR